MASCHPRRLSPQPLLVALALLYLFSTAARAQYLETTISVGLDPTCLLWNPASNKVYCSDVEEGKVYIIDGSTNQVITRVTVSRDPEFMFFVWNSRHNKVYCTTARTDRVWVIDGVTNEVIKTVRVGDWPNAMVYNPTSNKVYVRTHIDMRLDVIDGCGDTLLGSVPTGTTAGGPDVWHPATNRLFVANYYTDTLRLVDCVSDSVICSVRVGRDPVGACAAAQNGLVYYCCYDGIWAVSAARCSVEATVPDAVGTSVCRYIPYPNKLYAAGGDVYAYAIDCGSNRVLRKLRVGGSGGGMLCDTARSKVYAANRVDNHVVVIDASADTILTTIPVGEYPCALAWNSTDSRVYVANGNSHNISVIRDTTSAIAEETPAVERRPRMTVVAAVYLHSGTGPAELVDVSGRRVLTLRPGMNSLASLPPGVYSALSPHSPPSRILKPR